MSAQVVPFVSAKDRLLGENCIAGKLTRLFPMSRQIDVADAIQYAIERYRKNHYHVDNAVADAVLFMGEREKRINPNKLGVA